MQRTIGIVLLILGIIGTLYFGIHAIQESESFKLFGMEVAVSKANWTPVIVSAIVLIVGIIMSATGRRKAQ